MLELPRLISDGMVLQQKKKIHIWGWDEPGMELVAAIHGKEYETTANDRGEFSLYLDELPAGGPYRMKIRDRAGNEKLFEDIWAGDVWICSGQSNMELPMDRVKDRYPDEIESCANPAIRTFKITEHAEYSAPLAEHLTGEWKRADRETILSFSATAYFFAKKMYELTGVPVGLINASLGGSRIESWMSREMLAGYEDFLKIADHYADEEFVHGQLLKNQQICESWHKEVDVADRGLEENWKNGIPEGKEKNWKRAELPGFFCDMDAELDGFMGSVWFTRTFTVSEAFAKRGGQVWLGTIVDSDIVYINGVKVGETGYQYPPRKYRVPGGVLRGGENTIVIRVKCENGHGRFTPGKEYAVWNEWERVSLDGEWRYRVGAVHGQIGENDFVNWKPTGLYNGMMAPCHKYTIAGVLWYQGEANSWYPESYQDLMKRLIEGYRREWKEELLPFCYVQLPNFSSEIYDIDRNGNTCCWAALREAQRKTSAILRTGMVTAIDLGEDNDLHPLNKKEVGARLAMHAAKMLYGCQTECEGPVVNKIEVDHRKEQEYELTLYCDHCSGGLEIRVGDKGKELLDFEVLDKMGGCYEVEAEVAGDRVKLRCRGLADRPQMVRYCYRNTNRGALVYNKQGFPMSPFAIRVKEECS